MKAKVVLKINENYDFDGKIIYSGIDSNKSWVIYNDGYQVMIDSKVSAYQISSERFFTKKCLIEHDGRFEMTFKGNIHVPDKTALVKKEGYLEVNGNCGAIPLIEGYPHLDFEVSIEIPQGYEIIGFEKRDDTHYVRYHNDNVQVAIVMYKKNQIMICNEDKVSVYAGLHHSYDQIQSMAKIANMIFDRYTEMFTKNEFKHLHLVLNPRFEDGAYADGSIICLVDRVEGLDPDTFLHLAHEISHLWWKNSDLTIHNKWLDESFAQYSALCLVREKYGENEYYRFVERFKEKTKDLPSLSSLCQEMPVDIWFPTIYEKGPVLFDELEKEIGMKDMNDLLLKCYLNKMNTSDEFLKLCPQFQKLYKK